MPKVKIYTTPTCGYCHMAKEYFKGKNVDYEEVDVSKDRKATEEMVKKSGQMGVPVIVVTTDDGKEEIITGFDQPKVNEILGIT